MLISDFKILSERQILNYYTIAKPLYSKKTMRKLRQRGLKEGQLRVR